MKHGLISNKTTLSIGIFIAIVPFIFFVSNVYAQVQEHEKKIESQGEILKRIDENVQNIKIDVEVIKVKENVISETD
jgi:hypothetical protein